MFCIVKGQEGLGFAKVIESLGSEWTVEYFDSPADDGRHQHRVPKRQVVTKILGANTRVYYYSFATRQWLVGRVIQDIDEEVDVRFSNKVEIRLSHEEVFVRWKKAIVDPVVYLASGITETPQYAEARSDFLASYISQRSASSGLSALMSSAIELEPHQINVIRRVLHDLSQRYLLADEVGLGKTIEAGVIIRQAVLDDPEHHFVAIVVPPSLIQQWRFELIHRFALGELLDISVFVLPHVLSIELKQVLGRANLLVIDEAHHLAASANQQMEQLYNFVSGVAPNIERIILLSATPILGNENGFLKMLHLLDPVVYSLSDEAAFRTKIVNRQALAEVVAILDPQNVLQLDWALKDLLQKLPTDIRLAELIGSLQVELDAFPDQDDPQLCYAIRSLRAHLSETYRLHRRILRNRRKNVPFLTPNRMGAKIWSISGTNMSHAESVLEDWRIAAIASLSANASSAIPPGLSAAFWTLALSLVEAPDRLGVACESRQSTLERMPKGVTASFENETRLLHQLATSVSIEAWFDARLDCLVARLPEVLVGATKAIVFCSEKAVADIVFARLHAIIGESIVRHFVSHDDETDASWLQFVSDPSVNVIVCDRTAEEGLNLQGGSKVVIHFDLPVSPNRIEQRMGRVDRYGSGTSVLSIVLLDEGSRYQQAWFTILSEGLGVFDRSIASLQYLVESEVRSLSDGALFTSGLEALETLAQRLAGPTGAVTKELKLIDQQDGLDELSEIAEEETGDLEDVDGAWKELRQSFQYWAVDTLMFRKKVREAGAGASIDPPYRFQYRKPGGGGPATLIPLWGFLQDFIGALDFAAPGGSSSQPLTHLYCAHRKAAINQGARLLRYGDAFVDAIKTFSDVDDRGRSFAMWRQFQNEPRYEVPRMYFRFDFLIEAELANANESVLKPAGKDTKLARAALARRADALFQPTVIKIWLDEDGREVDSDFAQQVLDPPYSKEGAGDIYIDTNLKSERLRLVMEAMPLTFANWGERCIRIRSTSQALVANRETLRGKKGVALKKAMVEDEVRRARLKTRIGSLTGVEAVAESNQLDFESKLYEALKLGIESPSMKVDVAGVVIVSSIAFENISQLVEAA